jgi:hypothetical protein
MVPGWERRIMRLANAGFSMRITTNLARLLAQEELDAMARIGEVMVSIDTHRPDLQRLIRRRVDIGNILINMHRITATALKNRLQIPRYVWSCVINDKVALDLVDYVRFGLACGVRQFILNSLTKYDDIEGAINVRHVTALPDRELKQFSTLLEEARDIVTAANATLTIYPGLSDTVREELILRGLL